MLANRRDRSSGSRVLAGLKRVRQQGKKLGRPKVAPKVENAIRTHLSAGMGILKVAALVGVRSGTVLRVKRGMAVQFGRGRVTIVETVGKHNETGSARPSEPWTRRQRRESSRSRPATPVRKHLARQPYRELAVFADLALHRDRSAMLLRDDIVGDR
jgi:hypothetical protein